MSKMGQGTRLLLAGGLLFLTPQIAMATAFEDLVAKAHAEVDALGGKLNIALDWTDSDAGPVMEALKAAFPFITEINYTRETGIGPFGKYLISLQQGDAPPYDFMHIASEFEQEYWNAGAFIKPLFDYAALNDSLPADWPKLHELAIDPEGNFLSTTGNARGIIWNPDIVDAADVPKTWADCADPKWKGKVLMDARSKVQPFHYDPNERDRHVAWLKAMLANDVVLNRGQGGIVRKIAAGEYPIACAMNYHTSYRTIERDGVTTVKFTFAESIPLELGTRLYVPKWSKTPAMAQLFALWAASAGQEALGKFAYRGFTWNPKAHKYAASQGKYVSICGAKCALGWEDYNREYQELLEIPAAN